MLEQLCIDSLDSGSGLCSGEASPCNKSGDIDTKDDLLRYARKTDSWDKEKTCTNFIARGVEYVHMRLLPEWRVCKWQSNTQKQRRIWYKQS